MYGDLTHYQIEEVRAGVDWLSATMPHEVPGSFGWYTRAEAALRAVRNEGHLVTPRTLNGFAGVGGGGCFCGWNDERYYVQLAGAYADQWYDTLDTSATHYSRLDLQVTVRYREEHTNIAKEAYNALTGDNEGVRARRSTKSYLIVGSDGGDTLYVGAPSSRQRARIYNKAKQSEVAAYQRCWRYEVVLRDELARQWARGGAIVPGTRAEHVCATVAHWLGIRGVRVPFDGLPDHLIAMKVRTLPTDVERKLEWLRKQVAPTVKYLRELGLEEPLLDALGLSGVDCE